MKTREGLLRYDRLDLEEWCFDMEHEIIPVHSGMTISVRLDDRFQSGELLETPDGGLTMIFGSWKKNGQSCFMLAQGRRYLAKMPAATVEEILNNTHLLDMECHLEHEDTEPDTNGLDDLYF